MIDKQLYPSLKDGEQPPTKKKIDYAQINYPKQSFKLAIGVWDDDKYTKLHEDELAFHLKNGATIARKWESCILGDVKDPKDTISIGAIQIRGGKHETRAQAIESARKYVEQHNRTVHKVY